MDLKRENPLTLLDFLFMRFIFFYGGYKTACWCITATVWTGGWSKFMDVIVFFFTFYCGWTTVLEVLYRHRLDRSEKRDIQHKRKKYENGFVHLKNNVKIKIWNWNFRFWCWNESVMYFKKYIFSINCFQI